MPLAVVQRRLSGSTNGLGINITSTATGGTVVHTGHTSTGVHELLYIFANNSATNATTITIEMGSGAAIITDSVPQKGSGLYPLVNGLPLYGVSAGGTVISMFVSTTGIHVYGHVTRVTET